MGMDDGMIKWDGEMLQEVEIAKIDAVERVGVEPDEVQV